MIDTNNNNELTMHFVCLKLADCSVGLRTSLVSFAGDNGERELLGVGLQPWWPVGSWRCERSEFTDTA